MKKFLILFLLLACNEPFKDCNMTISDASEIQFWPVGDQSFNLKQEAYTEDACFHQKFLCTGTRKIQGYSETSEDYRLSVLDEGIEVQSIPFVKTLPLSLDILSGGSESGSGTSWTIDADPNVSVAGAGSSKIYRLAIFGAEINTNYQFHYDINKLGSLTTNGTLYIRVYDSSMAVLQTVSYSYSSGLGTSYTDYFDYVGGASMPAYIGVSQVNALGTTVIRIDELLLVTEGTGIYIHNVSFSPYDYSLCDKFLTFKIYNTTESPDLEVYYTDSVEFVTLWADSNHEGRVLIQYRSIQNFAGLLYDETSSYFSIELDGQFVEPDFQTTEKVLELTEMVINTASTLKEKTNLVLNDMPRYMHRKVLLALQHAVSGSVLVNDVDISLDGASYELTKRSQNYNLKPSQIMLTHKNSYTHNVI